MLDHPVCSTGELSDITDFIREANSYVLQEKY
jgi:hypothetical protein